MNFLSLSVAAVLTGGNALAANTVRFQDSACRIAFRHSSDWEVVKSQDHGSEQHRCWLDVRPKNLKLPLTQDDSIDDYTIAAIVDDVAFEGELQQFAYFERANGRWFALERLDIRSPAEAITGRGWSGIKGTASVGCYPEHSGYEGLCESPRAIISNARRSLSLMAGPQSQTQFEWILRSFEFRR